MSAVSTTDGWLKLNIASSVIRKARSLGAVVIYFIGNAYVVYGLNLRSYGCWYIVPQVFSEYRKPFAREPLTIHFNHSALAFWLFRQQPQELKLPENIRYGCHPRKWGWGRYRSSRESAGDESRKEEWDGRQGSELQNRLRRWNLPIYATRTAAAGSVVFFWASVSLPVRFALDRILFILLYFLSVTSPPGAAPHLFWIIHWYIF